jgi:hypothetical protein
MNVLIKTYYILRTCVCFSAGYLYLYFQKWNPAYTYVQFSQILPVFWTNEFRNLHYDKKCQRKFKKYESSTYYILTNALYFLSSLVFAILLDVYWLSLWLTFAFSYQIMKLIIFYLTISTYMCLRSSSPTCRTHTQAHAQTHAHMHTHMHTSTGILI